MFNFKIIIHFISLKVIAHEAEKIRQVKSKTHRIKAHAPRYGMFGFLREKLCENALDRNAVRGPSPRVWPTHSVIGHHVQGDL